MTTSSRVAFQHSHPLRDNQALQWEPSSSPETKDVSMQNDNRPGSSSPANDFAGVEVYPEYVTRFSLPVDVSVASDDFSSPPPESKKETGFQYELASSATQFNDVSMKNRLARSPTNDFVGAGIGVNVPDYVSHDTSIDGHDSAKPSPGSKQNTEFRSELPSLLTQIEDVDMKDGNLPAPSTTKDFSGAKTMEYHGHFSPPADISVGGVDFAMSSPNTTQTLPFNGEPDGALLHDFLVPTSSYVFKMDTTTATTPSIALADSQSLMQERQPVPPCPIKHIVTQSGGNMVIDTKTIPSPSPAASFLGVQTQGRPSNSNAADQDNEYELTTLCIGDGRSFPGNADILGTSIEEGSSDCILQDKYSPEDLDNFVAGAHNLQQSLLGAKSPSPAAVGGCVGTLTDIRRTQLEQEMSYKHRVSAVERFLAQTLGTVWQAMDIAGKEEIHTCR